MGGQCLTGTGIANNTPIAHAVALGAQRIYVLPTCDRSEAPGYDGQSAVDAALLGLKLMIHNRLEAELRYIAHQRAAQTRP